MNGEVDKALKKLTKKIISDKKKYIKDRYDLLSSETGLSNREIYNKKTMAIIVGALFGSTERGVALTFDIYVSESVAAGAALFGEEATELIKSYGVESVDYLNGKPIWVLEHGNMILWVEPCKIKVK